MKLRRNFWREFGLAVLSATLSGSVRAQEPAAAAPSAHRALVNRYCATCHNERLHTAELMLDKANVDDVSIEPQIWEKAVKKLRAGQMPPGGAPRPDKATLATFTNYLE